MAKLTVELSVPSFRLLYLIATNTHPEINLTHLPGLSHTRFHHYTTRKNIMQSSFLSVGVHSEEG